MFVTNPNRPNGGILARFEGLYIPILGVSFDGATPDDEYTTIDVARQYDLIADFPKYPLNLLADLNALMGYVYLHPNYGSSVVDLNDPSTYDSYTSGNTTYYLVHTEHLPLLQPFRDIGIPAPVIDLVEPTLRVLIELAYDRTPANMGVPTRAGLIPHINLDKLASDLRAAAEEGVRNALAGLGINTADTADRHTETVAALDKSVTEKVTPGVSTPEGLPPGLTRLHVPRTHPTRDNAILAVADTDIPKSDPETKDPEADTAVDTAVDAVVKAEGDIKTEVKTKTPPKPRSAAERIRQTVRQALSPKASDGVKVDESGADPHPTRKIHRTDESGSAQPTSGTAEAKDSGTQDKPRRSHRAAHSDAA